MPTTAADYDGVDWDDPATLPVIDVLGPDIDYMTRDGTRAWDRRAGTDTAHVVNLDNPNQVLMHRAACSHLTHGSEHLVELTAVQAMRIWYHDVKLRDQGRTCMGWCMHCTIEQVR